MTLVIIPSRLYQIKLAQKFEKLLQRHHFIENQSPQSYLISCIYWYFNADINYMERLYVVKLNICFYWKTHCNKTPSRNLCSFTKLLNTSKPANIYLFKVKKRNTRKRCKICSELTIKTPEWRQRRHPDVFIVNFEHYSHIFYCFYCWLWTSKC